VIAADLRRRTTTANAARRTVARRGSAARSRTRATRRAARHGTETIYAVAGAIVRACRALTFARAILRDAATETNLRSARAPRLALTRGALGRSACRHRTWHAREPATVD
jgi:hypothetical protein